MHLCAILTISFSKNLEHLTINLPITLQILVNDHTASASEIVSVH